LREIFVFTHDSVFLGEDGPTHQPIEQLAMLRAIPGLTVVRPADSVETLEAWKLAVQPDTGPWALLLSRQKLPFLGTRDADVSRGAYVVREAQDRIDLIFIATGSEVSLAIEAAELLGRQDVRARVVSMPSWELFDRQDDAYRERILPPDVHARISVEAAATMGWHRYVGERGMTFGIDHFGTSAPAAAIAADFGFTPQVLAATASALLASEIVPDDDDAAFASPLFNSPSLLRAYKRSPVGT
jgi:transketolase